MNNVPRLHNCRRYITDSCNSEQKSTVQFKLKTFCVAIIQTMYIIFTAKSRTKFGRICYLQQFLVTIEDVVFTAVVRPSRILAVQWKGQATNWPFIGSVWAFCPLFKPSRRLVTWQQETSQLNLNIYSFFISLMTCISSIVWVHRVYLVGWGNNKMRRI